MSWCTVCVVRVAGWVLNGRSDCSPRWTARPSDWRSWATSDVSDYERSRAWEHSRTRRRRWVFTLACTRFFFIVLERGEASRYKLWMKRFRLSIKKRLGFDTLGWHQNLLMITLQLRSYNFPTAKLIAEEEYPDLEQTAPTILMWKFFFLGRQWIVYISFSWKDVLM